MSKRNKQNKEISILNGNMYQDQDYLNFPLASQDLMNSSIEHSISVGKSSNQNSPLGQAIIMNRNGEI